MPEYVSMGAQLGQQALKIGWYMGLRELTGYMSRLEQAEDDRPRVRATRPVPSERDLLRDVAALLFRDAQNVRDGLYPAGTGTLGSLGDVLSRTRDMLRDAPRAAARARNGERRADSTLARGATLPEYYMQNFHFQDGGYLTEDSARLYDVQVETLFMGVAGAMRRQAVRPVVEHLAGRDQRTCHLCDVACGTGGFIADLYTALPVLNVTGVDLSSAYIEEARRRLGPRRGLTLTEGNAEALPLPDASQDVVSCVYLFHELPRQVRRSVIAEFERVLRPGGLMVFVDSLQWGDRPAWDGMLEMFPARFHEPYYMDYLKDPFDEAFHAAGLPAVADWTAFLSKIMVRRKRA